jgi:hypothetical protein
MRRFRAHLLGYGVVGGILRDQCPVLQSLAGSRNGRLVGHHVQGYGLGVELGVLGVSGFRKS